MNADDIWAVAILFGIAVLLTLRFYGSRTVRIFITDYQRGVRFVDGSFRDLLGPGSYRSSRNREQVTVVDMRPQPVVLERIFYQDAFSTPSVVSIAAELSVGDPYRATTQLKDPIRDSLDLIRDRLRGIATDSITGTELETRPKSANDVAANLNRELDEFGMRVTNLEITELWSRSVPPQTTAGAN
jgi:SPFH domain/Band 7 family protein